MNENQPQQVPMQAAPVINIVNNQTGGMGGVPMSPKSRMVYLLLWLFFGAFGVHNFYADRTARGLIELFTCGGCGILWLLDLFVTTDGFGRRMH